MMPTLRREPQSPPNHFARLAATGVVFAVAFNVPPAWLRSPAAEGVQAGSGFVGLILLAGCGLAVAHLFLHPERLIRSAGREPLIGAMLLLALVSFTWSSDPAETLQSSIEMMILAIFAYWLVTVFSLDDLLWIAAVAFAVGTIVNLLLIFGMPQFGGGAAGWTGVTTHRNVLGRIAVMSFATFLVAARAFPWHAQRWRIFSILALVLVLGSTSKTSLAALIGLTVLIVTIRAFRVRRVLYGAFLVAFVVVAVLTVVAATANLVLITDTLDRDVTLTGRTDLWAMSIDAAWERPWLGHGWSAFWTGWWGESHEILLATGWDPPHSHNALIDQWLDLGLVGLLLLAALYVRLMVRSLRLIQRVADPIAHWPAAIAIYSLLFSITEHGVVGRDVPFVLLVVAATFSLHSSEYPATNRAHPERIADRTELRHRSFVPQVTR